MKKTASLDQLAIGQAARIVSMNGEENMRRRLMDLGFTPGTEIRALVHAAPGDPTAYWIRGTVIALRADDAEKIVIEPGGWDALE